MYRNGYRYRQAVPDYIVFTDDQDLFANSEEDIN